MRKFVLETVLFLFFSFLFSPIAQAITPIPTSFFTLPVSGVNCGDASSPDPNIIKCCKAPINTPELITAQFKNNLPAPLRGVFADQIAEQINKKTALISFTQTQTTQEPCGVGVPSTPGDINNANCICLAQPPVMPTSVMVGVCSSMSVNANEKDQCRACVGNGGYWSALGCFSGNVSEFIAEKILGTGVGVAGGISMLCIMFAAFQMQTSSGNAEKIKKAQELLTNCITGLMIIIFSVLILKIIGVDILRLPGFRL